MFTIGKRISLFRKSLEFNRDFFGKKLNVSARTVQAWENDENSPPFDKVIHMVEIGANPDFLVFGTGDILKGKSA